MPADFLSKDAEKAMAEIKAQLYSRLELSRNFQHYSVDVPELRNTREAGYDSAVRDEIRFLENLIDKIERS